MLIVQKFGGSSVASIEKIQHVAQIIANTQKEGHQVVAVVSAMGKTTDQLVELAQAICPNPSGREYDALLSTGEMVSTSLLAMAIEQQGRKAIGLNGQQAGIQTEDLHNRARIMEIKTDRIQHLLNDGNIVIVTGFQGGNSCGDITTLGRGGSDTSAVALAAALKADRCDIYTDVRGVFSTDPRVVPEAVKLDQVAYIEMLELARVGAKVLHPRAVETARHGNVRLCVRSTFNLDDPGTLVVGEKNMEFDRAVAGVASDENQARLAIAGVPDRPGVAAEIFGTMATHNISVDMIIQSLNKEGDNEELTNDIAFTVSTHDLHQAVEVLEAVRKKIDAKAVLVDADVAKVSVVGAGMIDRPGIAADMFAALSGGKINIRMIATSEIKISCLVDKGAAKDAMKLIHQKFFPDSKELAEVLVSERLGY